MKTWKLETLVQRLLEREQERRKVIAEKKVLATLIRDLDVIIHKFVGLRRTLRNRIDTIRRSRVRVDREIERRTKMDPLFGARALIMVTRGRHGLEKAGEDSAGGPGFAGDHVGCNPE